MTVRLRWWGHSSFYCEGEGLRLVTDPFDQSVGYPLPGLEADLVTVSHEHYDHNAVSLIKGKPEVVRGPGVHRIKGLTIEGVATWHDARQGELRGPNTVFTWQMDGLRLCHLGDLGHLLDPGSVRSIGTVDLLMIPVGGVYTINAREAVKVVEQLKPRVIVPMHYQTPLLSFHLEGVSEFTRYYPGMVKRADRLDLNRDALPSGQTVVVFEPPD